MAGNPVPYKAPGHSAFNPDQGENLLAAVQRWAGTGVLQPHGGTGRFLPGSGTLPARLPAGSARLCLLSACRAEVCQIACICKMWARRAGRRNFPLKRLIFKRNEARAGEQKQGARLAGSYHAWMSETASLSFEQTSRSLEKQLKIYIHCSHFPGYNPPFPRAG